MFRVSQIISIKILISSHNFPNEGVNPSGLRLLGRLLKSKYSKTPIYRGFWGKANLRGKPGFAVNRGFTVPFKMF